VLRDLHFKMASANLIAAPMRAMAIAMLLMAMATATHLITATDGNLIIASDIAGGGMGADIVADLNSPTIASIELRRAARTQARVDNKGPHGGRAAYIELRNFATPDVRRVRPQICREFVAWSRC
jgi:hypothetical protein